MGQIQVRGRRGVGARSTALRVVLGLAALVPGGCDRAPDLPEPLQLLTFRQAGAREVALDESLAFHFSRELDRTSVTSRSLRIAAPDGLEAAGELHVDGARLTFEPALALAGDLSDGGLRPGVRYAVELGGFPRPDGLRATDGALLEGTIRLEFETARRGGQAPLFLGTFPERPFPLALVRRELGPLDPILLECGEAIDPTTVVAGDFELLGVASDPPFLALTAVLVLNERDRARLALRPTAPEGRGHAVLAPGRYGLRLVAGGPRGLGGRSVTPLWSVRSPDLLVRSHAVGRETIAFRHATLRARDEPAGVDATAHWPEDGGGVSLRVPAASGDGTAGEVLLDEPPSTNDLHATRLVLPSAADVDLSGHSGLVVLRSQGPMEIRGALRRRLTEPPPQPLAEEFLIASHGAREDWETLSAWLERARSSGEPWTVLVAGGELRVPGDIEVDGPLLLISGGWIRISGRVEADEVWRSVGGGENVLARRRLGRAPLVLDPPRVNRLRQPLSAAVLSVPIRPPRGATRWHAPVVQGSAGNGSFEVLAIGLRDGEQGILEFGPVSDPGLLSGCDAVRLLIRLRLPAGSGEAWKPPRVDRIDLAWDEPEPPPPLPPRSLR